MEWVGFVLGEFGLRKSLDSWPIIFLRKCRRGSFLSGEDSAQILGSVLSSACHSGHVLSIQEVKSPGHPSHKCL